MTKVENRKVWYRMTTLDASFLSLPGS